MPYRTAVGMVAKTARPLQKNLWWAAESAGMAPRERKEEEFQWETRQYYVPSSRGGKEKQYIPPCSARTADGVIRGGLVGMAWGFVFGFYEMPGALAAEAKAKGSVMTLNNKMGRGVAYMGSSLMVNGLGFAAFLGAFSGVACYCEQLRGVKDWKNSTAGGLVAGALAGMRTGNPQQTAIISVGTGLLTTGIFFLRGDTDP